MARKCPNCSTMMVAEVAHGVNMDVCPNCGGIWLNSDELKGLVSGDSKAFLDIEATIHPHVEQQQVGQSRLLCPIDAILLDEYHYLYNSPIPIHSCSTCGGLFIHADQLPQMQQWFERSHMPPTKDESLRIAMGMDMAQHEAFMLRQAHLQGMFNTFRRYQPGWLALLP